MRLYDRTMRLYDRIMRLYDRIEGRAQLLHRRSGTEQRLDLVDCAALGLGVGRHAGLELVALADRGTAAPLQPAGAFQLGQPALDAPPRRGLVVALNGR